MYDKTLKKLEERLIDNVENLEAANNLADLIIKIKTIQALDTSAELIAASRRVSRN